MYNKVIMIGRLTSTPELHKTNNDKSVARATIAVNRRYKDQNGEREADFVNIVLWGRLAETLASYATKGSLISVDGELRTRRFEKNGQMNYVTEVLVTGFQLLESRAQRAMRENNAGQDLADLVLTTNNLLGVVRAFDMSKKTFHRILLNLFWAFIYNVAGIPIAAGVFSGVGLALNPELAGLAMAFSSVSVLTSSLLLNFSKID